MKEICIFTRNRIEKSLTMRKIATCIIVFAVFSLGLANAQIRLPAYDQRIAPELLDSWSEKTVYNNGRWSASWITSPDADAGYGVYFFRKPLTLAEVPGEYIIHVSADNR